MNYDLIFNLLSNVIFMDQSNAKIETRCPVNITLILNVKIFEA